MKKITNFWQLAARNRLFSLMLLIAMSFAGGWFASSYMFERGNNTETTTITHPDGTVEIVSKKHASLISRPEYAVGVAVGSKLDQYLPVYRAEVGRRLFWDLWITASYDTTNLALIGIRLEF